MFTRIGAAAYKASLDNIISLTDYFDNPQSKFKSIHIAGTNGKGSTSHMLAAVLQQAGYKVGLFTSPHLKDFRERIKINGEIIPQEDVIDFIDGNIDYFNTVKPSFFEITTALAFRYFAKQNLDIAIIETGLGGRLDSTNIITPLLSIITNISWDHKDLLGDTLEKIAAEKAGIIKDNIEVIISETQNDVKEVFVSKALRHHSKIFFADDEYKLFKRSSLSENTTAFSYLYKNKILEINSDLTGQYQSKNIAGVLKAIELINEKGFSISELNVQSALLRVKKITGLSGRWDVLSEKPLTIADVGHNEAGIKFIIEQLQSYTYNKLHFVIGFVNDKDLTNIINLFPKNATYYFCKPDIPRGLAVEQLLSIANTAGLNGTSYSSVVQAFCAAQNQATEYDIIFIGGSTFVVAEVI